MIRNIKKFFIITINQAYDSVHKIYRGDIGFNRIEELTGYIRHLIVSAGILGTLTKNDSLAEDISVYQRILNICQVLLQNQDIVQYFESSAYQNRKGALRGAMYVETMHRYELSERQKKLPYQLKKSFHPERRDEFIRKVENLPEKVVSNEECKLEGLNHILPLVLLQAVDFDTFTMKLSSEFIPEFQKLESFLKTMGTTDPDWLSDFSLVHNTTRALRLIYSLDQNFSTVKKVLMDEREKTIQLLKGNIYNQHEMLYEWEAVLEMLSTRNDKGLIKFITQIIRDRKEAVDNLEGISCEIREKKLWQKYYEKIRISFVTSIAD
jgi:hypothetical protein